MSGVFYIIARVYVIKFEVCQEWFVLFSSVYAMKFEVCQEWFVLLSRVYVMKFEVCQEWFLLYLKLNYINTGNNIKHSWHTANLIT
jgi:hypothetical protein